MSTLINLKVLRLSDNSEVELLFGNGATEMFATMINTKTIADTSAALMPIPGDELTTLANFRKMIFCAFRFGCLARGLAVPAGVTEWTAGLWLDDIGIDGVLAAMDLGQPEDAEVTDTAKKKKMMDRVKASQ